jgi:hypothetical protein
MATIKMQGGKVILKDGKVSCTCCGCCGVPDDELAASYVVSVVPVAPEGGPFQAGTPAITVTRTGPCTWHSDDGHGSISERCEEGGAGKYSGFDVQLQCLGTYWQVEYMWVEMQKINHGSGLVCDLSHYPYIRGEQLGSPIGNYSELLHSADLSLGTISVSAS